MSYPARQGSMETHLLDLVHFRKTTEKSSKYVRVEGSRKAFAQRAVARDLWDDEWVKRRLGDDYFLTMEEEEEGECQYNTEKPLQTNGPITTLRSPRLHGQPSTTVQLRLPLILDSPPTHTSTVNLILHRFYSLCVIVACEDTTFPRHHAGFTRPGEPGKHSPDRRRSQTSEPRC